MKLHRIVKQRTNRGNDKLFWIQEAAAGLLFVFLLPYVCACLWGHVGQEIALLPEKNPEQAKEYTAVVSFAWGWWEVPMEEYLVYKLAETMPEEYEMEALKAQAVLLRTDFIKKARGEGTQLVEVSGEGLQEWYLEGKPQEEMEKYENAVQQTQGVFLSYQGEAVLTAYFPVSNGYTRDIAEVWHTEAYPYFKGAEVPQDMAAAEYEEKVVFLKDDYLEKVQKLGASGIDLWNNFVPVYDSAGYVTEVRLAEGETLADGETIRRLFGLASSAFTVEFGQEEVCFQVKGVGHGFGMSQYGANCMALNGKSYSEILKYFFCGTELAKI